MVVGFPRSFQVFEMMRNRILRGISCREFQMDMHLVQSDLPNAMLSVS